MHGQIAMVGAPKRLADAMWQMDIGGRHLQAVLDPPDADDPVQRMLGFFRLVLMTNDRQNLVRMGAQNGAAERQDPGGTVVGDALASLADPVHSLDRSPQRQRPFS